MAIATDDTQTVTTPTFVQDWLATLADERLDDIVRDPARAAVFSTDMLVGFCDEGPLASPRVGALKSPVKALFERAWDVGIREFVLTQDTHSEDTPEFRAYPPHCVRGTAESQTIPELAQLPFADRFTVFEKNSLNPAIDTEFDAWWDRHPDLQTAIVVGNCTDFCVYQLAMHLRMRANAHNLPTFDVFVPVDCVDTFDIPAGAGTAMPHPGEFFHHVFLYHMAVNGIRIVRTLR
ncbi:MAG: cysteine hydrolase [Chloroflexota bacterium]|nr:cysteine hydrolase [Chloroflexota bacterium]